MNYFCALTWHHGLPVVPAAEAGDAARDEDHEADGDAAHDEEELEVDLAVPASVPVVALAGDVGAADEALPVAVAQIALRRSR